jgi:inorganic pyrophosphatase
MYYPANYGFIPNMLSEDGDPCDCMALSQLTVAPCAVIRCRPIGALLMEDENGIDEKIIAVPVDALYPFYDGIGELTVCLRSFAIRSKTSFVTTRISSTANG